MVNRYVFQRLMALAIRHLQSKTIRDPVTPGQKERGGGGGRLLFTIGGNAH